jgi:glycosyltransferase involved in cell wall biosynthesis
MVIPLTANVAHISLTASRSLVVLEEAWERALPRLSPKSAIERLRYKWLYAALERTGHPIVAITEREASFYRARVASRVETVRYGVDLEHFTPMPRHEPSIDVLILGAVNRPEQLVEELVGKLRSEPAGRDVACCIVGSGARPEIEALADSRTTVTGYVEDVTPFYARARVVAIPTFTGIGVKTTMLQAWASGRAVVTSPAVLAGALDGRDAAVVATDTGEMARAILRLLHDDPRRERMEKAGRAVVEKNYDARANTATFARLLTEVSAGSRCGGGKR